MELTPQIHDLKPDSRLFCPERFQALVDCSSSATKAIQETLQQADKILGDDFKNRGNIKLIIRRRAWLMDQLLTWLWQQLPCANSSDIALLAVGGYGRAELHPRSDIDLMILLAEDNSDANCKEALSDFITQLWDIGLEVGQSVRSLAECVTLSQSDITIATNLMEARTITGNTALCETMLEQTGPQHIWPVEDFFEAKWKEQITRHHKHNNTEYNLEPDIKSAPGGLRDIQMIGWVAKRYFGANRLSELQEHGFLTKEEYAQLNQGHVFLWEVRYALHLLTNRSENRLLFDFQKAVATMLGYEDTDTKLAVELLMQDYYREAITISQLNDMLLQHFEEAILEADKPDTAIAINNRFRLRNAHIEVTHDKVFEDNPSALLEIFVVAAQTKQIEGVRASTIRLIRNSRHLIDQKFREDARNISLFMELLLSPYNLSSQFERMSRYGILGAYLPAFGKVMGQMQYDLFHQYTVDAHTLRVFRNLRKFRHTGTDQEFPMASFLYHRLPKIELLYLAGIFHDLGKGRKGDHSLLGAQDAYAFCLQHNLNHWDAQLVAWLVEFHLLMSLTAQKQDVSDPDVIHTFAKKVGHQIRLDYLYVLTVADICATNANLWNGWRATLLETLYNEARSALRRGLENPMDRDEWIQANQSLARDVLNSQGINDGAIDELWEQLEDSYFLRETTSDIARHTAAILEHDPGSGPLILLDKTDNERYGNATQIFVYTPDSANLFAATATALTQLHLSVVDARIITAKNEFSLDTYVVMEENGNPIETEARLTQVKSKLFETLSNPDDFPDIVTRRLPRALKHFSIPTTVKISQNTSKMHTIMEITTLDRPGLLAEIGSLFLQHDLNILGARIATLGEKAEDVFYMLDSAGQMITDPKVIAEITDSFINHLDRDMH